MADDDRLSGLPDDLLRRVLFFTPVKEAASTCVLSRRWRWLWPTSGAINLDTRSFVPKSQLPLTDLDRRSRDHHDLDDGVKARERFIHGAEAALAVVAAHGAAVTRLTVHVEAAGIHDRVREFLADRRFRAATFSHPAAQRVAELFIAVDPGEEGLFSQKYDLYKLSFRKMPHEDLRVLHVTNFTHLKPPRPEESAAFFPQLAELHLLGCVVTFNRLQRIIDASPQLATLHLESCCFPEVDNVYNVENKKHGPATEEQECSRLVCPAVTHLVFADCNNGSSPYQEGGLEIEAPGLRYIRYHGLLLIEEDQILLKLLAASNLIQADLDVIENPGSKDQFQVPFWQFIHDFRTVKVLSLKTDFAIDYAAVVDHEGQDEVLGNKFFHNLECLHLEGCYESQSNAAAVTIANFLHCCPVLRDLRIKLSKVFVPNFRLPTVGTQARLDFDKSVDHFKHRRRQIISMGRDDDDRNYEVSDIPGLSEHSFNCLQSFLRRVRLQFSMENPNCFGEQLAKFFSTNACFLKKCTLMTATTRCAST